MAQGSIKRALVSVTDKTGVVEFVKTLEDEFGVEVISTGGTARVLACCPRPASTSSPSSSTRDSPR